MSNAAAIATLENHVLGLTSAIKSNKSLVDRAKNALGKKTEVEEKVAERISELQKTIDYEKGAWTREEARLKANIEMAISEIQKAEALKAELETTLTLLKSMGN